MNYFKTFFLMALMSLLLIYIGDRIWGGSGAMMAFLLSLVMNLGSYWFSDRIVLGMYGARELREDDDPALFRMVRALADKADLPMPRLYEVESPAANAFATGRNPQHAAVAVTSGIRHLLSERELAGVLAHELAHVKNRDILTSTVVASMAGAIMMLSRFAFFFGGRSDDREESGSGALLLMILAPIAAALIQMAVSRSREYAADEAGAQLTGDPHMLADALRKLVNGSRTRPLETNQATAHLFIVNPLSAEGLINLFNTHPPLERRIARLQAMRV